MEAYLDSGDGIRNNTALFDKFEAEQAIWNERVGFDLAYERLEGRRACRIATHHPPVDVLALTPTAKEDLVTWAVEAFLAMYDALDGPLRATAKPIRDANVATGLEPRVTQLDRTHDKHLAAG